MPPAPLLQPLALPSCSWPCSPPPPQGRWPVCAERGACAPSLPHSFLPPPFFLLPPSLRPSAHSGPRSPAFPAARHSTHPLLHLHFPAPLLMRSSPPPFFLLPPFLRPSAHSGPRFPAFTAVRHSHPLLHSSISTSPLLYSCVPPRPLFFFFHLSFVPPPIRDPVFPCSPPCNTPLRSSAHPLIHLHFPAPPLMRSSPPPFFLLPPFLRPSAHSGPRFPAFPAVRHSPPPLHAWS